MPDFVFGRHGAAIPDIPASSKLRRIHSLPAERQFKQRWESVVPFYQRASLGSLEIVIQQAMKAPGQLHLVMNPNLGRLMLQYRGALPGNLKSFASVFGFEAGSTQEAAAAYRACLESHGQDFLLKASFNAWQTSRYHHIVERALRSRSTLDEWFYHVPTGAMCIHNVALESRPGRKIVVLDFNAMYPSVLDQQAYPIPGKLERLGKIPYQAGMHGAFRVTVSDPDEFMRTHHMHAVSWGPMQLRAALPDRFQTILHGDEIEFWSRHARIEVEDGVFSREAIAHPLAFLVDRMFERRLKASNAGEKRLAKHEMVLLHASTTASGMTDDALSPDGFKRQYGANEVFFSNRFDGRGRGYDIENPENVYCLQRQVLACAKVKLLRALEAVNQACPDALLCYANVDSMHLSVPEGEVEALLAAMPMGPGLGSLKLEAIGDAGLWLEQGRWWIAKDGKLELYRSGGKRPWPKMKLLSARTQYGAIEDGFCLVRDLQVGAEIAALPSDQVELQLALSIDDRVKQAKALIDRFAAESGDFKTSNAAGGQE